VLSLIAIVIFSCFCDIISDIIKRGKRNRVSGLDPIDNCDFNNRNPVSGFGGHCPPYELVILLF
jgi:hypothetical protein